MSKNRTDLRLSLFNMMIPNFSIGLHRSSNKIKEEFGKLISSPDITSQSAKFLEQNAGSIFGSQPKELINKLVDGIALFEKTSNIHNHLGAYKNGRYTTINNGGKNTYVLTPTLDQLENFLNEMNSKAEDRRKVLIDEKKKGLSREDKKHSEHFLTRLKALIDEDYENYTISNPKSIIDALYNSAMGTMIIPAPSHIYKTIMNSPSNRPKTSKEKLDLFKKTLIK